MDAQQDVLQQQGWGPAFDGLTIGSSGAEGGTIARDETNLRGARLTLELNCTRAPCVVTCSVEGWMLHARLFGGEEEAQIAFDEMKPALDELAAALPAQGPKAVDAETRQACGKALMQFLLRFS